MLIVVIVIGLLYALPNLFGEDPAVQITGARGVAASEQTLIQVQKTLQEEKITAKSVALEEGAILARFDSTDTQLRAREALMGVMGDKYVVALNLAPATPRWLAAIHAEPMKLGLDLRGGVHFLMEVDMDTALGKLQEQNIDSLRSDLREKGIPYTTVRKENNYGLSITFRDAKARDEAIAYLSKRHPDLVISSQGSNQLRAVMSDARLSEAREYAVQQNINILRNRVNQLGVAEPVVQRQGADRIVVELPGIQDTARAKEILGATATLEFRLVNTNVDQAAAASGRVPGDSEVKQTREGQPVVLYKRVILTGDHITDSTSSQDEYNQPQVNISLDSAGGNIMSNFTKDNIGKPMATLFVEYKDSGKKDANGRAVLVKQEEVINIANIQSRLGNSFRITGINNPNEARQLSLLLRAGALIAPIQIVEERTIGPTLGMQNIEQGLEACLAGLLVSILFMIIFYKKFGLIATSALIANLILIVGIMSLLPGATLSMPGIAGIVLTLAVAVDANVLINERIKEELSNGRTVQQAIDEGYRGAFSSIFDANITTLIKVIILYAVGTGKSFLAGCIANALLEQEIEVRMNNFAEVLNDLSANFSEKNTYIKNLCRVPLLILDDFGMERGTEYGLEQIYAVIDGRYRSGKPLIVTTNLTLQELKNPQDIAHARIYDRLLEMCVPVQFKGESFRKRTAQEKLGRMQKRIKEEMR